MFKHQEALPIVDCKESEIKNESTENEGAKYDPQCYCRTCANKDAFLVPIFKGEGLNHQLNKKIEKYLPIQVTKDDDLPLQLCYNCASTIIAWDTLVIGCLEAEKKLRSLRSGTENYMCVNNEDDNQNEQKATETYDGSDGVDSDDEPLIAKKLGSKKCSKKRVYNKQATEEKNEPERSVQQAEKETDRRTESALRRRMKTILITGGDVLNNLNSGSNGNKQKQANESDLEKLGNVVADDVEYTEHRCPVCLKSFTETESFCEDLYSHLENDFKSHFTTDAIKYKCKVCSDPIEEICKLPSHLLAHIDAKMVKIIEENTLACRKRNRKRGCHQDAPFKSTCEICGKAVSRKYTMKRHLMTHSGEKRFTCHHCGKQYAQESGLQRHMSVIHEGVRKYKCPICSRIFGSNFELKSHQYTHTDPRPFQCDQCGRTFIRQKHLYHHRKYHHTANGLRQLCKICNKYFSSPGVLKRHHKVIHLGLKEFQCHICSTQLSTKQYLLEHLKIHTDERPEVCTFCGKTFQMAGNLRQHIKIHLEKTQICDICGKAFTRRCHLITHMGSHKGVEQPQCDRCQKTFMLKVDLEKHLRNEHSYEKNQLMDSAPDKFFEIGKSYANQEEYGSRNEWSAVQPRQEVELAKSDSQNRSTRDKRVFQCNICNKVLNRRFNFERHLLVHSGETLTCHTCGKQYRGQSVLDRHIKVIHQQMRVPSLSCDFCGKGFSSRQSLEDHFRTHTGERPFICEICGKDFRAKPNLIAHKKIHSSHLPFSCNLCDYKCRLKGTFIDHCQRHEGKRTFLCSICGKGFVNNYDLSKHKKTHSKDRMFSCTSCNLTFVMKRYLKVHMKTHMQKSETKTTVFKSSLAKQVNVSRSVFSVDDQEFIVQDSGNEREENDFTVDYCTDWDAIPKSWLEVICCKYCGKISCASKHLKQHEQRKTCTQNFECNFCQQSFTKKFNLEKHIKKHERENLNEGDKRFTCGVCNKKFKFEDNGLTHEKLCGKGDSTYKCSVCGKRFETKTLADQHSTSHHKSCVCHMCGQSFNKPESLKQHIKTVHEEFKMVCHYCGREFTRKARLQEHLQHHTGQMDFTCHICGKGSTNAYSFSVHLATHTQETPYSCSFCPRTFKHMKYVYLHERAVHLKLKSGKTYVKPKKPGKNVAQRTCPLCNKTFKRESAMLIHKRSVHEGKNGYICKLCGKDFKYTYLLYVHKKKHHFPELCKYICQFCEKPFPVKTELEKHLRKHTGEKPYICNLCGKTYSFHGSLNMHMKTQHENKKNFKCDSCDASFNFRSHLARHMSAHAEKFPVDLVQ